MKRKANAKSSWSAHHSKPSACPASESSEDSNTRPKGNHLTVSRQTNTTVYSNRPDTVQTQQSLAPSGNGV